MSYTSPSHTFHLTLQIFICLNLNGIISISLMISGALVEPYFTSKCQMRSAWYVLVSTRSLVSQVFPRPQMFQIPWLLTMSIAAAWMYRALQDFLSSDMYDIQLFLSSSRSRCDRSPSPSSYITSHNFGWTKSTSETRGTAPIPIPLNGVEVGAYTTVTAHERSLTSQTSHNSLGRHTDKLASDKPHGAV